MYKLHQTSLSECETFLKCLLIKVVKYKKKDNCTNNKTIKNLRKNMKKCRFKR